MDYELAKELKGAGFPQFGMKWAWAHVAQNEKDQFGRPLWKPEIVLNDFQADLEFVAAPTLEELITACADQFLSLVTYGAQGWAARGGIPPRALMHRFETQGYTPTEAVARPWLALNVPSASSQPDTPSNPRCS